MKQRKKLINLLLYFLIFLTTISYIGYVIYALKNGYKLYFSYIYYNLNVPFICDIIRFFKEGILILWLLLMLPDIIKNKKTIFYTFLYALIILFGCITLHISENFYISIIIMGIRCYLYFYAICMYCFLRKQYQPNYNVIYKIITFGNLFNSLIVFCQILNSVGLNFSVVGQGGHRYFGIYGGCNSLGAAALGFTLFTIVAYKKNITKSKIALFMNIISTLFLCVASGSRSSMISLFIILLFSIFDFIKINKKYKKIIFIIIALLSIPCVIFIASQIAGRGDILQVQLESGRIKILLDTIKESSIFELLFGKGLGVATNAYYLLSSGNTEILDGTFTLVLYQYGVFGLILLFMLFFKIIISLYKNSDEKYISSSIILVLIIQMLTGNIFELYTFIILFVLSITLLICKKNNDINYPPKISIVSVCYNCENDVEETINSLLNQTYSDIEYIIIDGASKDNTLKKVEKMTSNLKNVKIISEPDHGIYDAMNKGANLATGDFVYFLNMGDKFLKNTTLEKVSSYLKCSQKIYYGNIIYDSKKLIRHPNKITNFYFLREKMICHQSIFAPREFLKKYPFKLEYKYCADRDWLYHWVKQEKCLYEHIPLSIAVYDVNGFSSQNSKISAESKIILRKYYPEFLIYFVKFKNRLGKIIKH